MFKKILAMSLAMLLIFAVGCKKDAEETPANQTPPAATPSAPAQTPDAPTQEPTKPEVKYTTVNPLTGLVELDSEEKATKRPIAIMVNNMDSSVQKVQTGLSAADIVYETEVEGGITRLLAVYKDITQVEKIGSVRSARYQYIDLAMGHNAIYVHCGVNKYAQNHLNDVNDIELNADATGSLRISNGLSSEHTLYAITGTLNDRINKTFNMQGNDTPWVNFTDETLVLKGGSALNVSVPFPTQTTKFVYDNNTGLYTRYIGEQAQSDYFTKEATQVKNVFILSTSKSYFEDGKTPKIALESGSGYYITNGTMQTIRWSKGSASNGFTFTDAQTGEEIQVSAGNSWVCIVNKSTTVPKIQ